MCIYICVYMTITVTAKWCSERLPGCPLFETHWPQSASKGHSWTRQNSDSDGVHQKTCVHVMSWLPTVPPQMQAECHRSLPQMPGLTIKCIAVMAPCKCGANVGPQVPCSLVCRTLLLCITLIGFHSLRLKHCNFDLACIGIQLRYSGTYKWKFLHQTRQLLCLMPDRLHASVNLPKVIHSTKCDLIRIGAQGLKLRRGQVKVFKLQEEYYACLILRILRVHWRWTLIICGQLTDSDL